MTRAPELMLTDAPIPTYTCRTLEGIDGFKVLPQLVRRRLPTDGEELEIPQEHHRLPSSRPREAAACHTLLLLILSCGSSHD